MEKLKELSISLAQINDPLLIERFLKSILTPNEIEEVSTRWALVQLLDKGMSQRKISKKLGLSLCKITRGSRELKKNNSAFKEVIEIHNRISKQRN